MIYFKSGSFSFSKISKIIYGEPVSKRKAEVALNFVMSLVDKIRRKNTCGFNILECDVLLYAGVKSIDKCIILKCLQNQLSICVLHDINYSCESNKSIDLVLNSSFMKKIMYKSFFGNIELNDKKVSDLIFDLQKSDMTRLVMLRIDESDVLIDRFKKDRFKGKRIFSATGLNNSKKETGNKIGLTFTSGEIYRNSIMEIVFSKTNSITRPSDCSQLILAFDILKTSSISNASINAKQLVGITKKDDSLLPKRFIEDLILANDKINSVIEKCRGEKKHNL